MSYTRLFRIVTLIAAGAMPVLPIPLSVMGVMSMTEFALFLVMPLSLVAVALMVQGSPESRCALQGLIAGLAAVTTYDAVRIPMVLTDVWPDFIPDLGGWVLGTEQSDLLVGYLWRYLGDGGGIGMAFFVFCNVVTSFRPSLIAARPILLSIGYGVFIWSGLCATVVLVPNGSEMLFPMSPANFSFSLLGHLIYGGVLGLFLSGRVAHPVVGAASMNTDVTVGTNISARLEP
jgi:hypothetical protein